MNLGVISRNVGIALISNAAFMFLSAIVSGIYGFDSAFSPLLLSSLITFLFGIFPLIFVRGGKDINTREGLAILMAAWLLSCIFGMLPYILWGGEFSVVNAWFESTSGITTTGATILNDIESLPHGLLFWRSSSHYLGGLGVVVFMMMILPSFGSVRFRMSKMEMADVSRDNYHYVSDKFIKVVITVYIGLTVCAFLALLLAGMPAFDAINHAFSVCATGGFSVKNASIAAYGSVSIEIILMIFMILASLHFGLIYASFASRSFKVFQNPVTKFYLATILVISVAVGLNLLTGGIIDGFGYSMRVAFFEVISTISTTGFAIADTNGWPIFSTLLLLVAAIQCGCSGSTTSGLRSDRVWIVNLAARAQIIKLAHPNAVVQVRSGKTLVDGELLSSVTMYVLLYLLLTLFFALIYSFFGFDLLETLGVSVSMMSNVGPAFGSVGTMSNFAAVAPLAKWIMGVQMIIGRLGIYSALMVLTIFDRRY
ncbi:MAG: TrkH family potassium uptake protein [Bacteroidales bacterium]|nr:TrkH family potassium uptake protein [Bacteroidales bacterium]